MASRIRSIRLSSVSPDGTRTRHSESVRKRFRSIAAHGHVHGREKVNTHPNHLVIIVNAYPIPPIPDFPSMTVEDLKEPTKVECASEVDSPADEFPSLSPVSSRESDSSTRQLIASLSQQNIASKADKLTADLETPAAGISKDEKPAAVPVKVDSEDKKESPKVDILEPKVKSEEPKDSLKVDILQPKAKSETPKDTLKDGIPEPVKVNSEDAKDTPKVDIPEPVKVNAEKPKDTPKVGIPEPVKVNSEKPKDAPKANILQPKGKSKKSKAHSKTPVPSAKPVKEEAKDSATAHIQACENELAKIRSQVAATETSAPTIAEDQNANRDQDAEAQHAETTARISSHVAQIVTRISSLADRSGMVAGDADSSGSVSQNPQNPAPAALSRPATSVSPLTTGATSTIVPKSFPPPATTAKLLPDLEATRQMSYDTEPLRINAIKKPDPVMCSAILPKANKTPIRFTVRKISHEPGMRNTSNSSAVSRGSRTVSVVSKESSSDESEENKEKLRLAEAKMELLEIKIAKITKEIDFLKDLLAPNAVEMVDYSTRAKIIKAIGKLEAKRDEVEKKRYNLGISTSRLWRKEEDNRLWVRNCSQ